jgi:hypothetical protein
MRTSELKPGMKGYGLSVFSGTEVERFEAEVIDVIPGAWPRTDLILCRLSGCGLEESGIVVGMSGSPVYIDGKLIGAVAYGWGFSKQPIAGVTPIGAMLDVWKQADAEGSRSDNRSPIRRSTAASGAPNGIRPLALPLAVSGLTPGLTALLSAEFSELGLLPVAASGRSSRLTDTAALVPGAAVGVALVDGDVQFSAIGTLTHRDGSRILGFGHPMFQAGKVNLPLIGGIIHSVLPSVMSSFRLFSPTSAVGAIVEDRLPGVGGIIGPTAPMIPVTADLSSQTNRDRYRFRVIDQENLAGGLLSAALADVVYQTEGSMEDATLDSRITIYLAGSGSSPSTTGLPAPVSPPGSFVIRHRLAGPDPAAELFRKTRSELDALWGNDFQPVTVDSINIDLRLRRGIDVAFLDGAEPDRSVVRPGEVVRLVLRLRDYRGRSFRDSVSFTVPVTAAGGELSVVIASPDTMRGLENARARQTLEPRSLGRLIELLAETGRENELVVAGFGRDRGVTVGDAELPAPPPSLRSVVRARDGAEASSTWQSRLFSQSFSFDRIILGSARARLEVRR